MSASPSSASSWNKWLRGRAGSPDDEPGLGAAQEEWDAADDHWADEAVAPATEADDEFGIDLHWPAARPGLSTTRPLSTSPEPEPRSAAVSAETPAADEAPQPGPLLPFLASRIDAMQSTITAVVAGLDAQQEATVKLFDLIAGRLDGLDAAIASVARREVAAPADLLPLTGKLEKLRDAVDAVADREVVLPSDVVGLAPAEMVGALAEDMAGAVEDIRAEIAQLRDDIAQLRRRIPVRAKREEPTIDGIVAAVRERFDTDELGTRVGDVVVERLLDVADVMPVDEQASPFAPPAEKRGRRRSRGGTS